MKTLWIHAGLPKNGSSALQVFFAKNRDQLLDEGIEYLDIDDTSEAQKGGISSGNSALFSRSLLNEGHEAYKEDDGALYDRVMISINNSNLPIGLLSSEFFAVVPLKKIEKFKVDLESYGVTLKMIYYARRQDQFLMSSYMQRVKRHKYVGYPGDFILSNYNKNKFLKYFDYANNIEKVLGVDNVLPLIFESTKKHPKGISGHFIESIIGSCPKWIEPPPFVNSSLSPLELKLMLMANRYSPRMTFSDFLVQNSIQSGKIEQYSLHNIVPPRVTHEVLNYFKEQNKKFEYKYGKGEKFPDYIEKDYVDIESLTFSSEEVLEIVAGYLVRFDKRIASLEK